MFDNVAKVLIATDDSKASLRAIDIGIRFAKQYNSKVYAVYVMNVTAYDAVVMDESWSTEMCENLDKESRRATSSIVDKAKFAGLDAEPFVLKGDAADEILKFADNNKIDVIVVGSHGRNGLERFTLGSVSEKIVRHAQIPVLVAR